MGVWCGVYTLTAKYRIHVMYFVSFLSPVEENRDILDRAGFFEKCGKEWVFPSIQDAVHHAQHGCMLVSMEDLHNGSFTQGVGQHHMHHR